MMDRILVVCEQRDGVPSATVLELVSAAANLATAVEGVTWGPGGAAAAAVLGAHGLARLLDLGDLGDRLPAPRVADALAARMAGEGPPAAVLVPMSYDGRDVAARLSARLDRPVLANVVGLRDEEGGLVSEHEIAGGAQLARARFTGPGPGIFVVRPKSFAPASDPSRPPATVEAVALPAPGPRDAVEVVARHVEERTGPGLEAASVVVAGGRGLGDQARYARVERLAELLHGAPAASRAIVDAGWVPYAYQVGQTGKTVKPDVYVACGISGATQHLIGMKGSHHVVAINKDPAAPIFGIADLGVVGDVNEVLPRLIAALEAEA
ncbi:MAG: electron transfer flavoprotein subunit alpha/FixB family protein [Actinomycetota bacterium]|nr:electron transfer flavoprotein subunit alpha/FixB family protein [Actinomycetota bacterium]